MDFNKLPVFKYPCFSMRDVENAHRQGTKKRLDFLGGISYHVCYRVAGCS